MKLDDAMKEAERYFDTVMTLRGHPEFHGLQMVQVSMECLWTLYKAAKETTVKITDAQLVEILRNRFPPEQTPRKGRR